ncbi:2,3-dihydro-2,3-dihydroxybenzoate dehydrogenase [Streptomyces sp. NPDC059398]|uniref:2,3-dihydro-2,3-dihydroxybenzoate dehydrogenase n=1 Tax=Streptomyces sp. NPDC059398 TaxID=3346820 RepID=UPI0036BBFC98
MDEKEFSGKVALVTGAGGGIGRAVAQVLAEAGARVVAVDLDGTAAEELATDLRAAGGSVVAVAADVSDSAAATAAVATAAEHFGPVDHLVNVAGVLRLGPVATLSDEDWRATFAVNTDGVFYMSRAAARVMRERGSGAIVTVASNAARVPRSHMAAYAASKAASASFTKSLGLELAPFGIRCNVVNPGSTDTPMLRGMGTNRDGFGATIAGAPESYRVGIPLGRVATPVDVAGAVSFLLSERAAQITLHELCVDGGAALGA